MFQIDFAEEWYKYWKKVPKNLNTLLLNRLKNLKEERTFRHLKLGLPYFVMEIDQYRVCFIEENQLRTLVFIGDHKEYEKWYSQFF